MHDMYMHERNRATGTVHVDVEITQPLLLPLRDVAFLNVQLASFNVCVACGCSPRSLQSAQILDQCISMNTFQWSSVE